MGSEYSKDENFVFQGVKKFKDADPETFEVLNWNYSRDKNFVFKRLEILEDADPKTFEIPSSQFLTTQLSNLQIKY